jgi:hypothetical protein
MHAALERMAVARILAHCSTLVVAALALVEAD